MSSSNRGGPFGITFAYPATAKDPAPWEAPSGASAAGLYRVQVADASGRLVGTVLGWIERIGWQLNEAGRLWLTVPGNTDPRLIQPRNRIIVEFDSGLPLWGGVIDWPARSKNGAIVVTAYSGEVLLTWRAVGRGRYFRRVTVGHIFESVLREATRPELVKVGAVWQGGELHSPSYHYRTLDYIIGQSVLRLEPCDYAVVPRLEAGRIVFYAELYRRRGRETDVVFHPTTNAANMTFEDQGPVYTDVLVAGAGSGWGSDSRIYSRATSETAARRYGLRERPEVRSDVSVQSTLDAYAESVLVTNQAPYTSVELDALNAGPWGFGSWQVGDSVLVFNPQRYEHLQRRVVAFEFAASRGTCQVVLQ